MMAAPTEWKTLPTYAAHVATLLPKESSAAGLTKELRSLRSPFTNTRVSLPLHCTVCWLNLDATCPVVANLLSPLNEWFLLLGVEVYEIKPGKLALRIAENQYNILKVTREGNHAAVLLHCVMTRHRCVEALDELHPVVSCYAKVFCDALQKSTLKVVRVTWCMLTDSAVRHLMRSICGIESITELSLDWRKFYSKGVKVAERAVASIVAQSKSLRVLDVTNCSLFWKSVTLIESLEKNESIEELMVGGTVLTDQQGTAFHHFLSCNKTLRTLTIEHSYCESSKVDIVFNALLGNSTLNVLRLKHFHLDLVTALAFVRLIAISKSLLEVDVSSCYWDLDSLHELPHDQSGMEDPIHRYAVDLIGRISQAFPFILALKRTSSLRRLSLPQTFCESDNRQLLTEAVNCHTLEQLCFDRIYDAGSFYQALQSMHACNKVKLNTCLWYADEFVLALQSYGKLLSGGVEAHKLTNLDRLAFHKVIAALPLHDHITGLDLSLSYGLYVTVEDATLIAGYLSSTRVLKNACFRFHISKELAHIIVGSLCKNDTIEKLSVRYWEMDEDDVDKFCTWVAASRKVYHLYYFCGNLQASRMLSSLHQLLSNGYTLTSLYILQYSHNYHYWHAVQQLMRRNLALVECAVSFVLGSTLKRAATAFERIWWHPQVASRIQQKLQLGPTEVSVKFQECKRRLQVDFWQIAGVVRSELVCHERADQKMQIDQLGMDAWLCVRAFLTLSDVLDGPPKKQLRKRKRV